ncbi:MAG: trigger factor [Candidatus Cloacimonas sp. 4484_140]|nr:MAG: trigger factor [Candidatus Cloacimonas sp. 4484_140]
MELKPKIEKLSDTKRKMSFSVPKDVAQKDYETTLKGFSRYVSLPGFRKGRAPLKTIERMYKDQIKQGFFEDTVPKYYKQALEELDKMDIHPINQGVLEDTDWEPEKDMELSFIFEVNPEIELKEYKNFSVEFEPEKVTKKMIDGELSRLQKSYATISDKDTPSEKGDVINYTTLKFDGKDITKKEESSYKIGQEIYGKAFDEALIGAEKGNEIIATVELGPQDEKDKSKKMEMVLKVNEVKKVELPELNDDFAKQVGEFDSLKTLKDEIKKDFDEQVSQRNKSQIRSLILQTIIEKNPFEVPESFVDNYAEDMMKKYTQQQKNLNAETLAPMKKIYKSYAENEIRIYYVMNRLKELEKVEVSDEEIENEIKSSAEKMGMDVEKYKELYKKQIDKEEIKESLISDKIIKNIERTVDFKKPKKQKESKKKESKKEEK